MNTWEELKKRIEEALFSAYTRDIQMMLEGTFINGLDSKLKAKVKSRNLVGLEVVMRQAQSIDNEMQTIMEIKGIVETKQTKGEGKAQAADKTCQGNYYRPNVVKIQLPEKFRAPRREWAT